MSTSSVNESANSQETTGRSGLRARLTPLLAALGLVQAGAPLPELSGWRQVRGRTA